MQITTYILKLLLPAYNFFGKIFRKLMKLWDEKKNLMNNFKSLQK